MADCFKDPDDFFAEFDKDPEPSDKLLLNQLRKETNEVGGIDENGYVSDVSSECDSDGDNAHSDNEHTSNKDDSVIPQTIAATLQFFREKSDIAEPSGNVESIKDKNDHLRDMDSHIKSLVNTVGSLRHKLKLLECRHFSNDAGGPAIQMVYMNSDFARRHRHEIDSFICGLFEKDSLQKNRGGPGESLPPITTPLSVYVEDTTKESDQSSSSQRKKDFYAIGCSKFFSGFIVDTLGWPLVQLRPELTEGWEIPVYEQFFRDPLPCDEEPSRTPQRERRKLSCFNCGGEHSMKDCTVQKDFGRINQARQEFLKSSPSGNQALKQSSYSIETDPRFSRFKPGVMSSALRDALGLDPNQLPPYIYKMRVYGYPPGWLIEAESTTEGIAIFDGHGQEVAPVGAVLDPGDESRAFDPEKIVVYPGFNEPHPPEYIDEFRHYQVPPMQPHQLRSRMIHDLTTQMSRKRKCEDGKDSMPKRLKTNRQSSSDMDISGSSLATDDLDERTLDDLEAQRLALEAQLQGEDSHDSQDDGSDLPPLPATPTDCRTPLPAGTPPVTPDQFKTPRNPPPIHRVRSTPSPQVPGGELINSSLKTPGSVNRTPIMILESSPGTSSGKGLPQSSKFAEGISEHINFENLPNTTGGFEKVRKVLKAHHTSKENS